jgi:hypothetical protein
MLCATVIRNVAIALAALGLTTGLVFAKRILWPDTKPPGLALPEAYACAMSALGSDTNRYHCVRASCLISRSPDGEWMFEFYSPKGFAPKTAFVFFNKTTRVEDGEIVF